MTSALSLNRVGALEEDIEDAARELADEAFFYFAEKVKVEIPIVLEENREAIREMAASAIKQAIAESSLDARLRQSERRFVTGLVVSTLLGVVGGAIVQQVLK